MKIVGDCTNITRSFCDLTDVWVNMTETYIPKVVGFRGNAALVSCMGSFFLTMDSESILFIIFIIITKIIVMCFAMKLEVLQRCFRCRAKVHLLALLLPTL